MHADPDREPTTASTGLLARLARHGLRRIRPIDLFDAWMFAESEATVALAAWRSARRHDKADAYATYLAAFDRESQAARALELRLAPAGA